MSHVVPKKTNNSSVPNFRVHIFVIDRLRMFMEIRICTNERNRDLFQLLNISARTFLRMSYILSRILIYWNILYFYRIFINSGTVYFFHVIYNFIEFLYILTYYTYFHRIFINSINFLLICPINA